MRTRQLVILAALVALAPSGSKAAVSIPAVADNTLYQDGTGGLSNGAGQHMFCGVAGSLRRALVRFDVAGNVPAGATITQATLTLTMTRTSSPTIVPIGLHRVTNAWGEGTSDAGEPGGTGTAATAGDATWIHTFFPASLWTTPGGDFSAVVSATTNVQNVGVYTWTSPQLIADVQDMLDNAGTNFGWVLIGSEGSPTTNAKRFSTRENAVASSVPSLSIEWDSPVGVEDAAWSAVKALFR
jgi:hypothetical protein